MCRVLMFCAALWIFVSGTALAGEGAALYPGTPEASLASRTALVIGVDIVQEGAGFASLSTPSKDAGRIKDVLKQAGFSVRLLDEQGLTRQAIKKEIYDFAGILKAKGGVGLIYFAGHGVERDGRLYLVPFDAFIKYERDFYEDFLPESIFYDAFEYADNPLNILFIDACRDNPWTREFARFGIAPKSAIPDPQVAQHVVLSMAAPAGGKAFDGVDSSPFAHAILAALQKPDLNVGAFFEAVLDDVRKQRKSLPTLLAPQSTPADRNFYFLPTVVTYNREESVFNSARKIGSRDALTALMDNSTGGYFWKAAMDCLDKCQLLPTGEASNTAVVEVPTATTIRAASATSARSLGITASSEKFRVADASQLTAAYSSTRWLRVERGLGKPSGYVQLSSARPVAFITKSVAIEFDAGTKPGLERVSQKSLDTLKAILSHPDTVALGRLEITGKVFSGKSGQDSNRLQLQSRQAAVIEALEQLGHDVLGVKLSIFPTAKAEEENAVYLNTGFSGSGITWAELAGGETLAAADFAGIAGKWKLDDYSIECKPGGANGMSCKVLDGPKNRGIEMIQSGLVAQDGAWVGDIKLPANGDTYKAKMTLGATGNWSIDACTTVGVCAHEDLMRLK